MTLEMPLATKAQVIKLKTKANRAEDRIDIKNLKAILKPAKR